MQNCSCSLKQNVVQCEAFFPTFLKTFCFFAVSFLKVHPFPLRLVRNTVFVLHELTASKPVSHSDGLILTSAMKVSSSSWTCSLTPLSLSRVSIWPWHCFLCSARPRTRRTSTTATCSSTRTPATQRDEEWDRVRDKSCWRYFNTTARNNSLHHIL